VFLKRKVLLFVASFYGILLFYVVSVLLFPNWPLARLVAVFESVWATFVFLAFCLLSASFLVSELSYFLYRRVRSTRWFRPKLGEILVSEGYLTDKKLREALSEQGFRIGEVLVQGGRITTQQLNQALGQQKKDPGSTGEILIKLGYATQDDIIWALNRMDRRLGRILRDKGYLSDHEVRRVLFEQHRGPR
jgi:hypothetical protein